MTQQPTRCPQCGSLDGLRCLGGLGDPHPPNQELSPPVIWKYQLPFRFGPFKLTLPIGSKILHVDNQAEAYCIWALHSLPPAGLSTEIGLRLGLYREYEFEAVPTGAGPLHGFDRYVGTAQVAQWVLHIFAKSDQHSLEVLKGS